MAYQISLSQVAQQRGIGYPDYSQYVSAAKARGGLYLEAGQSLKVFARLCTNEVAHPYAITWVKDRIAAGATQHLIDIDTGLETPFTVPQGYTLNLVQKAMSADEDAEMFLYMEFGGTLFLVVDPGIVEGGQFIYSNQVVPYNTATLDPLAAASHQVDFTVKNRGLGAACLAVTMVCIMEEVGTPPLPTSKDCQCPFCQALTTVEISATVIVCSNCGLTFIVQDNRNIRRTA